MDAGALRRDKGLDSDAIFDVLRAQFSQLQNEDLERLANEICGFEPRTPIVLGELTEGSAAEALVSHYGEKMRYCAKAGGWLLWDGKRWKRDDDGSIFRIAKRFTKRLASTAVDIVNADEARRSVLFALGLRKQHALEQVVKYASTESEVAIGDPTRFDADPWLFNVNNGTIDLKSGNLLSHDRANLLTKLVAIDYDPKAACPRWLQFLDEIFAGDQETINFVQRAVGYTLSGSNREHCLFVLHGTGANGKSTFLGILSNLLGDYGRIAAPSTFLDRQAGGATNDLAALRGARFVSALETSERAALAENFVKATTGGDKISARYLYQEYFEFEAIFKLWLGTNHKPVVKGVDEGIWRRIRLVPFSERFEGDRRDEELRQKLEEELPGILAWAIQGCQEWQRLGLKPSQSVSDATKTYRTEMDTFAAFLEEQCSVTEGARAKASDLYQSYRSWAEANGEKPVSQRWFGLRLSERGFVKKSVDGYPHYQGLGLSRKFSAGENDA